MANSIRVAKRDIYTIEVNDNGDTIEFDLLDIELPFKLERSMAEVDRLSKALQAKLVIIDKKQDHKQKGKLMTANEEARLDAYKETFKAMRVAMDLFLGDGACQKIFGDRNYIEMYDDLFTELAPHFDKMKLNTEGISARIKAKYAPKDESVLT